MGNEKWERENIRRVRREESVGYVGEKQKHGNKFERDVGNG